MNLIILPMQHQAKPLMPLMKDMRAWDAILDEVGSPRASVDAQSVYDAISTTDSGALFDDMQESFQDMKRPPQPTGASIEEEPPAAGGKTISEWKSKSPSQNEQAKKV